MSEPGWPTLPLDRLEAVVFDTDGVLTDTASVHAAAWKRLFDEYLRVRAARDGEPFRAFEEADYLRHVDGRPRYDGVAGFLASRGIELPWGDPSDPPDRETVCGLGNAKDRYFVTHLRDHGARAFPTSVALVRRLRERGLRTAVVSASRNMVAVLESAGLRQLFDAEVDGVEAARLGLAGKPDPALFLEAARRLGVAPARAAVVEDALAGVEAGRRGRFAVVVGVDRGGQAAALAERGADVVVADLGELALEAPRRMEPNELGGRADPGWTVVVRAGPRREGVTESLCALADGRFGTRGVREEAGAGSGPVTVAAGVFSDAGGVPTLLAGPVWTGLEVAPPDGRDRRELDLRGGVLRRTWEARGGTLRSLRFASLAQPGVVGLRVEGPADAVAAGPALLAPGVDGTRFEEGHLDGAHWARTRSAGGGGITAAARQRTSGDGSRVVERLAVYLADQDSAPAPEAAVDRLRVVAAAGFDRLLDEHRAAWAARWADAEVTIDGDPDAELAVRFALFHLLASAGGGGEAGVGARGLSGPVYAGHVFWDADVFVLPALAAVHPAAARAMVEYRIRRLEPARRLAAERGLAGARFAWESAADGTEVTPEWATDRTGRPMRILTGEQEDHIVADVPWAACRYADWTGDTALLEGPGRDLLLDTARYWASRARWDEDGLAHIDKVIGPDEYHVEVDDNAFTNVMARWNLRRAAALAERAGGAASEEIAAWRRLAGALVDGYDPASGRYRQFDGFDDLEPLLIGELARPPVIADALLGRERVEATQVVKQADVLMLHLLVPEETEPGSLEPDLAFYDPRTAHGSSLSPAVHAALLARAGDPERALELFRLACRLDLDDLTGTSAGGLHVATMGGVWQALATGFLGLRPSGEALVADPCLPAAWEAVELRLRYRGRRLRVRATHDGVELAG
ncbi:MAG TPA: beta-phosphoglucomutase family hydrolase [Actinomycetota bacterium]|nr:beta-phosphoglucomutase family hydrolase [Actinomycetota bacterium]